MMRETWCRGGPPPARAVRRRVNLLAALLELAKPRAFAAFNYAAGDLRCPSCADAYRNHAAEPLAPGLFILCDGRRIK